MAGRSLHGEPGLGPDPVALYGAQGDTKCMGRVRLAQAGEKTAFDDSDQSLVVLAEGFEAIVQVDQSMGLIIDCHVDLIEAKGMQATTASGRTAGASMINDNLAHGAGGDGEIMAGVSQVVDTSHFQPRFMDQLGSVEGWVARLPIQLGAGNLLELLVNQGQKALNGLRSISIKLREQGGDLTLA
jgi:hypothetical protein